MRELQPFDECWQRVPYQEHPETQSEHKCANIRKWARHRVVRSATQAVSQLLFDNNKCHRVYLKAAISFFFCKRQAGQCHEVGVEILFLKKPKEVALRFIYLIKDGTGGLP